MITQRSEYKIADVSAVPSITGDILPVRDGTASAHIPKMEDLAFLLEAFAERGLAYGGSPLPAIPFFPPYDAFWNCCIGYYGRVRQSDVAGGSEDRVYGTGDLGYNYSVRECYPIQVNSDLSSFPSAYWEPTGVCRWLQRNRPEVFWWSSALPVHYQDFKARPIPASMDLLRRMYYLLRIMRRWLICPRAESEAWGCLSLSGTASCDLVTIYHEPGGVSTKRSSGTQPFAGTTQATNVAVHCTGDSSFTQSMTTMFQLWFQTWRTGNSSFQSDYDKAQVVNIQSATFKTRIRFSFLATFLTFEIHGVGYSRRSGSSATTDVYTCVRRFTCSLVSELSGDPDGFVQQWAINLPGLSPVELRAYALSLGFHLPGTSDGEQGELNIGAVAGLTLDGIPIWRTEIDSTGWDWAPPSS